MLPSTTLRRMHHWEATHLRLGQAQMGLGGQIATKSPGRGEVILTPKTIDMSTCKEGATGTMNRRLNINSIISHLTIHLHTIRHHSRVQWPCQKHRDSTLSIQRLMISNTCISTLRRTSSLPHRPPTISGRTWEASIGQVHQASTLIVPQIWTSSTMNKRRLPKSFPRI